MMWGFDPEQVIREAQRDWDRRLADAERTVRRECWLFANGWAESADEDGNPIPAGYMADPIEQERECRILRAGDSCPVHAATPCSICWIPLHPYETSAPGLGTLTLTTCPVCDRYNPRDDA